MGAATLCGAQGAADVARFGQAKEGLLRSVLRLEHGIPSHDTFSRLFRVLDPQGFERQFQRFTDTSRTTSWPLERYGIQIC